ncbi:MAG: hypothetical protein J6B36_07815 [Muribaculaceae bacterium]|jgi:hypothetical protein|nr:hypothetical protein [Muribaculaceae bacterium]CCX47710.1 unknown [Bacteroides sp. CAG:927]
MSPIVDTLTQNLINEWQDYFEYWSATHGTDSEQDYRAFTHDEITQAQRICNRLQKLDDCFNSESSEYSDVLNRMGSLMR